MMWGNGRNIMNASEGESTMIAHADIFQAARKLDFPKIRRYVLDGGDVNIFDKNGRSLITVLIENYLVKWQEYYSDAEKELIDEMNENKKEDFLDGYLCEELRKPLDERVIDIKSELDFLIDHHADLNIGKDDGDGDIETPLMMTVGNLDYYMTEYLIEKGANPRVKLSDEETSNSIHEGIDYYLMEQVDIEIFNLSWNVRDGKWPVRATTALKIAGLLHRNGLAAWNDGLCFEFDKETGIPNLDKPRWKY